MGTSDKVAGKTKIVKSKVKEPATKPIKEPVTKPVTVKRAPAGRKIDLPDVKAAASKPAEAKSSKTTTAKAAVTKAAQKLKDRAKK